MPSFLIQSGTPRVWDAAVTDYALTFAGVLNTEAREGGKGDLGEQRAEYWTAEPFIELVAAPTAGLTVELFWSNSNSAVPATENDGGASGVDGDYKNGEEEEWVAQLDCIGILRLTNDIQPVLQKKTFVFRPKLRWGSPIILNKSGQTFHSDDNAMKLVLTPHYIVYVA